MSVLVMSATTCRRVSQSTADFLMEDIFMENKMYFENGIVHTFSDDEMTVLKQGIVMFGASRELKKLMADIPELGEAYKSLKSLFEHVD